MMMTMMMKIFPVNVCGVFTLDQMNAFYKFTEIFGPDHLGYFRNRVQRNFRKNNKKYR